MQSYYNDMLMHIIMLVSLECEEIICNVSNMDLTVS